MVRDAGSASISIFRKMARQAAAVAVVTFSRQISAPRGPDLFAINQLFAINHLYAHNQRPSMTLTNTSYAPAISLEDEFGIVYLVENAQQFWSGACKSPCIIID